MSQQRRQPQPLVIDPRAVLMGTALIALLAVPTLLIYKVITIVVDTGDNSNLPLIFTAILFVETTIGGARAGRRRPDAPMAHGALAALVAYTPYFLIVGGIAFGTSHSSTQRADTVTQIIFGFLLFASAGLFGGMLTMRRPPRRPVRR